MSINITTNTKQQLLTAVADRLDNMEYGEEINPDLIDFCKKKDIVIAMFEYENERSDSSYKIMGALDKDDRDPSGLPEGNPNKHSIWYNLLLHSWHFLMYFDSASFNVIHNGKPIKTKSVVFYKSDNQEVNISTEINTEYSKGWTYTGYTGDK